MTETTIFSLDYDGCSYLLFEKYKINYDLYQMDPTKYIGFRKDAILSLMQVKLKEFLQNQAKEAKEVELYIGSNRQSPALDRCNGSRNRNGSSFANFPNLCKEMNWTFRPLLLADVDHQLPAGSVFKNQSLCLCASKSHFDRDKIQIIKNQLLDVAINHPHDEVHFYFIDDDPEKTILPGLKSYFEREENREKFKHIHLHLYEFDYYKAIAQNIEPLKEIACIQGKKEVVVTEPSVVHSAGDSLYHSGLTVFDSQSSSPCYQRAGKILDECLDQSHLMAEALIKH